VGIFKLVRTLLFLPINLVLMPFRMMARSMMTMTGFGLVFVVLK
jgi:hypothetical protein